jgi:hypothetical protein
MTRKINFLSGDLNGNGKTGFFERMLGLDPGIRAVAGAWRGATGRNQLGGWSPMTRQNFTTSGFGQPQDFTNSFSNMGNTGLSGGSSTQPWSNPYQRQSFGLSAPQMPAQPQQPQDMFDPNGLTQFGNTGLPMGNMPQAPRVTPNKMPVRNDLDFMNTAGSAYQSRNAPLYPSNPMTANNGYFDMGKASTAGGNWIPGVGWRTDANKAMGQSEEDMQFNAQMAQRIGMKAQ